MKSMFSTTIHYNTGYATELLQGQIIRISGQTTVDAVFFNLRNLRERFDQARTKICHGRIFVTKGDKLFSKFNTSLLSILDDSLEIGHHDLQFGMCSAEGYALFRGDLYDLYEIKSHFGIERERIPNHGCWENLTEVLKPWGIPAEDIPSPFNIFQKTCIDGKSGRMELVHKRLDEPAHIDLRADMDCLVGLSACPWLGCGEPINVEVFECN